jgi:methylated-DNA-[protein]-cysteine S-methyltransferase
MIAYAVIESPVGRLLLAGDDDGLRMLESERPRHSQLFGAVWRAEETPLLRETRRQLGAYFAGRLRSFELPLAARGTAFQQRVWHALRDVPYGATCSYADIARRLGAERGARSVGAANGRNPIAIIVPCHRVIGADGSLTGYGGGLAMKRFLLQLEGALHEPFC